ncbi:energy transducer TonB [Tunturiibacter lichenicola]|uniref:energy transducer TonB n=1 Tax=Tunturiibacter lichenicola TaxID=2051959 RepID=UPI003D9ADC73
MVSAFLGHASAESNLAADRLHSAIILNSIDDPQLKPWHLKLSFQLFDVKGVATEKGAIEEWWGGPSSFKIDYTSPSYTATELHTKDGILRSRGAVVAPALLELALRQVVHPIQSAQDFAPSKPTLQQQDFGNVKTDCIMLVQEVKNISNPPLGLFPTYCLDRDNDRLRLSYDFGSQVLSRDRIGVFQERRVVSDQTIYEGSVKAITAHLETLQTMTVVAGDLDPSPDLEKVGVKPVSMEGVVTNGRKIGGDAPHYPPDSRKNHVSGSVVLAARIGGDGRIHSLRIISAPATDLAVASIAAVRTWTYTPYLLDGRPTDIETHITVNFNFGS